VPIAKTARHAPRSASKLLWRKTISAARCKLAPAAVRIAEKSSTNAALLFKASERSATPAW